MAKFSIVRQQGAPENRTVLDEQGNLLYVLSTPKFTLWRRTFTAYDRFGIRLLQAQEQIGFFMFMFSRYTLFQGEMKAGSVGVQSVNRDYFINLDRLPRMRLTVGIFPKKELVLTGEESDFAHIVDNGNGWDVTFLRSIDTMTLLVCLAIIHSDYFRKRS